MQVVRPQPGSILFIAIAVLLVFDLMPHPNLERGFVLRTLERARVTWSQR